MPPTASSLTPVRIAVAGLGKMGVMHAAMISRIPGAELVAAVDRSLASGKQLSSMTGRDLALFDSIEACLAEARPDGVIVCTPQSVHRAICEPCLRAGVAVLVEKPLAHTLADARAMAALARERPDVPAGVGFMLGHNPLLAEAARHVREGRLGAVRSARASCYLGQVFAPGKGWTFTRAAAGGGVLINSGSHLLFALLEILGPARAATARASGVHNEVEDTMTAIVDFESGVWASVDVSWSAPGYEFQTHDVALEGTAGALEFSNEALRLWLARPAGDLPRGWSEWRGPAGATGPGGESGSGLATVTTRRFEAEPRADFTLSPDYCGDEFLLEDLDFVEAIRDRRPPKVGWEQGLRVQELLDAIYRSAESGRTEAVERTI